jgi:hypothetical protein
MAWVTGLRLAHALPDDKLAGQTRTAFGKVKGRQ